VFLRSSSDDPQLLFASFIVLLHSNGRLFGVGSARLRRLAARRLPIMSSAHVTRGGGASWLQKSSAQRTATRDQNLNLSSSRLQTSRQWDLPLPPLLLRWCFPACSCSVTLLLSSAMQYVCCPAILVLVALVLCGPGVSSQPDRDQDQYQNQDLDPELRPHRLLQRARNAGLLPQVRSRQPIRTLH